jgi:hypothetical protein
VARAAEAAAAAVIVALLAACGSSGTQAPVKQKVASKPHHITGRTHPGGNTNKGE